MNITQLSSSEHLIKREENYQANTDRLSENRSNDLQNSKFPIPGSISVKSFKNEDPRQLHRRILLEAASEAGLDGTGQQKAFVEKYLRSGISFVDKKDDPSKEDGLAVKSKDITGEWITYNLSDNEKADLRRLQTEHKADGGALIDGKTYENSIEGEDFSVAREGKTSNRVLTDGQYQARKARQLWEQSQLINSTFGTPSKLNELKRAWVVVGENVSADNTDAILSAYINKNYGRGNLWGEHKGEILELAKERGVGIKNVSIENGVAKFDISVESLLNLHIAYISVQAKVNEIEAVVDQMQDKMALNQFLKGVGEGAWGALKENWKMVTHPLETIKNLKDAISVLTNLSNEDLLKIYENLKAAGHKFVFEKDLSEVSRDVGKIVGAVAVELALGKGTGLLLKALKGTKIAAQFVDKTKKIGDNLGKIPIPTPSVKVITDTLGNKIAVPDVELKKLADIIRPLEKPGKKSPLDKINDPLEITSAEYKDLRKKTPSREIRNEVNPTGPKIDPVYKYYVERLEADHIVSMKEITNMPGFDKLSQKQQLEILNLRDNFLGLGKRTNASKGAKTWADWAGHSRLGSVPPEIRAKMIELEQKARIKLREAIDEMLKSKGQEINK